jgi:hypothetical protein
MEVIRGYILRKKHYFLITRKQCIRLFLFIVGRGALGDSLVRFFKSKNFVST